jgi:hypothetical protein
MRVRIIRSANNRVLGLLVEREPRAGAFAAVTVPHADYEYWRMCESCHLAEAVVFCRSHACFLCNVCISHHQPAEQCDYLSRAAAREIAQRCLCTST